MRLSRLLATIFLTLIMTDPAVGQSDLSVRGMIVDCHNSHPISDAEITFDRVALRIETDGDGSFAVFGLPEGYCIATVSAPAYHTRDDVKIRIEGDFTESITICLEPIVYSAESQQVVAERDVPEMKGRIIESGSPEFESAVTLGDLLDDIPELEVQYAGSTSGEAKVSVKGGPSKEVLVLLNGVSINSPITGEADINSIPLGSVNCVEFREGGESATFGAGAVSGVLSIKTVAERISEISLDGLAGQYDEESWGGGASLELGKYGSVSAARSGYTASNDFFFDDLKGDTPRRDNADIWRLNDNYSTSFTLGKLPRFDLSYNRFEQRNGIPGFQYQLNPLARKSETRSILSVHTRTDRPGWYLDTRYSFKDFKQGYVDSFSYMKTDNEYLNDLHQINTEMGVNLPHGTLVSAGLTGAYETFGIDNNLSPDLSFEDVVERRLSALLSVRKQSHIIEEDVKTSVNLHGRLRSDISSFNGPVYSPSISGGVEVEKWCTLRLDATYGKSYRTPLYSSLFWMDGAFAVGNPDLEPERLEQSEASISVTFPIAGQLCLTGLYTHSSYRDLIYWHRTYDNKFTPRNLSGALIYDRTFRADWDIDPIGIRVSYSNTDQISKNRSWIAARHDMQLVYRPRYLQHFSISHSNRFFDIEYRLRHSSKRYIRDANTKELEGFTVADLAAGVKWNTNLFSVRLQYDIHNLTNEEYQLIERYPLPGRRWSLAARITVPIELR